MTDSTVRRASMLLMSLSACGPAGPTPTPAPIVPGALTPLTTAPCTHLDPATQELVPGWKTTDKTDRYGINTRTGCVRNDMALGSVAGAEDLSLVVSLVRNEGQAPPAWLYGQAWFGLGGWLTSDEYVTKEAPGHYVLHTPSGDVDYDFEVKVPYAGQGANPVDDQVQLFQAFRTRPFDGTFLFEPTPPPGGTVRYRIVTGNPYDTRSLSRWYEAAAPAGAPTGARLLSRVTKASIYQGPTNAIRISRNYVSGNVMASFGSSLFDGSGLTPLVVRAGLPRTDGQPGQEIVALTTLRHGWQSNVIARTDAHNDVEWLISRGRKAGETLRTHFEYRLGVSPTGQWDPTKTVLERITQEEGTAADLRRIERIVLERGDESHGGGHLPFAVKRISDQTQPNAEQVHVVTACDSQHESSVMSFPLPKYLTFNYSDGNSVAHTYGAEWSARMMLVRTATGSGDKTLLLYNPSAANHPLTSPVRITEYELRATTTLDGGASDLPISYWYDKLSADRYRIPLMGKSGYFYSASFPHSDKDVYYRAVFGSLMTDTLAGTKFLHTFLAPRVTAGADGFTRSEARGLDGFLHELRDEAGVITQFRWDQAQAGAPNADGTFNKEVLERRVMGFPVETTVRDAFGRLLERVVHGAATPATTTYHLTPEGFVDRVEEVNANGKEALVVLGWNASRSAITAAELRSWPLLASGWTTIGSFTLPADDLGNPEGQGTVTLGSVTYTTNTTRLAAGLLETTTLTGPSMQPLTSTLGYALKETTPRSESANGQPVRTGEAKPRTNTMGGCK